MCVSINRIWHSNVKKEKKTRRIKHGGQQGCREEESVSEKRSKRGVCECAESVDVSEGKLGLTRVMGTGGSGSFRWRAPTLTTGTPWPTQLWPKPNPP